jgi:hypothetical protein
VSGAPGASAIQSWVSTSGRDFGKPASFPRTADCQGKEGSKSPLCRSKRDKGGAPWRPNLAGAAQGLRALDGRDSGDGGDHHAREQLHGCYIAVVEGTWCG